MIWWGDFAYTPARSGNKEVRDRTEQFGCVFFWENCEIQNTAQGDTVKKGEGGGVCGWRRGDSSSSSFF